MKVSVIMPAYNTADYVQQAVRAVLSQRGVSFELLIVDDASTDDTWERLREFRSDPRVHLGRFRKRRGAAAARNFLIYASRGKYISICDSDDQMLAGNLQRLSRALDRHPEIGVVCGRRVVRNQRGWRRGKRFPGGGPAGGWDLLRMQCSHPGSMIRRNLLRAVGGYDPRFFFGEDHDLFLRLVEKTRFLRLEGKPVYLYHGRRHSLSHQSAAASRCMVQAILRKAIRRRYGIRVPW